MNRAEIAVSGPIRLLRTRTARGLCLTGVLGAAIAVRLVYLHQCAHYPNFRVPYAGGDAALYHELAKRVAAGDLALGTDVYHYSPIYAYLLGLLYALFGDGPWVARLLNVVLGTGTVALVFLYTRRLYGSARPCSCCSSPGGTAFLSPWPSCRSGPSWASRPSGR